MNKHLLALLAAPLLAHCAAGPAADQNFPSTGPTPQVALTSAFAVACGVYSNAKASWNTAVTLGLIQLDGGAALWNGASEAALDAACLNPPIDLKSATTTITAATSAMLLEVAQAHQGSAPLKVPAVKL